MAHTSIDKKTDIDRALTLLDKLKAMITKMVATKECEESSTTVVTKFGCPSFPHHPPFHPHVRPSSGGCALPA
jgi:hypothetical protein